MVSSAHHHCNLYSIFAIRVEIIKQTIIVKKFIFAFISLNGETFLIQNQKYLPIQKGPEIILRAFLYRFVYFLNEAPTNARAFKAFSILASTSPSVRVFVPDRRVKL